MVAPILTTKLNIPSRRRNLVRRQHLLERLSQGLHRKLTLVSAPAGFGKTTLLAEWVEDLQSTVPPQVHVGWISLDDGDNDPARLLAYLAAALQRANVSIDTVGGDANEWRGAFLQPCLVELINQVERFPQRVVLVLDDYHLITSQAVHDAVAFFVDHQPENLHLVIATRADPPLPFPRLRARGYLTELRQSDLRFTTEEAAAFLNALMGLDLSVQDVAALEARTEGWIAGLQMAALSLQGYSPRLATRSEFVREFTGSHRFILDYLVEEVLEQQQPAVQDFLLQTSILELLTGPLCDAVTGEPGSQATLERLEAANLFIVPLDHDRHWYRYHRLFSDLLRKRLLQTSPELVPALHRRASVWYERQGLAYEAIDHALDGRDFERAGALIEENVEATLMRSEVATFLNWVERLPDEWTRARPNTRFFHAWALLMSGRSLEVAEQLLKDVRWTHDGPEGSKAKGRMIALQAYCMLFRAEMDRAGELCRQALDCLPESDLFLRSIMTWILGLTGLDTSLQRSSQTLEEITRMGQEIGNPLIAVTALCHQASLQMRRGRLHRAQAILERALQLATDSEGRRLPIASEALMGLGRLYVEWNELETAARFLNQSIELTKEWSEMASFDAYFPLARVRLGQGDVAAANEAAEVARRLALRSEFTDVDDLLAELQWAYVSSAQEDFGPAMRWAERRGLVAGVPPRFDEGPDFVTAHLRKYEFIMLARLYVLQDRGADALELLEPLLAKARELGRVDLLIEIQILRALAYQTEGQDPEAMDALSEVLSLAEPGGYVRIFLDAGEPMAVLLRQAASRGISLTYVLRLLEAFDELAPADSQAALSSDRTQPLVDPLSERELEVLRLLATGMSNPTIAEELTVAVSTIRSHCKSIYSKLNVHSRWDAVQQGRDLGLI